MRIVLRDGTAYYLKDGEQYRIIPDGILIVTHPRQDWDEPQKLFPFWRVDYVDYNPLPRK